MGGCMVRQVQKARRFTYLHLSFVELVMVRLYHDQVLIFAGEQCNLSRCVSAKHIGQEQRGKSRRSGVLSSTTFPLRSQSQDRPRAESFSFTLISHRRALYRLWS